MKTAKLKKESLGVIASDYKNEKSKAKTRWKTPCVLVLCLNFLLYSHPFKGNHSRMVDIKIHKDFVELGHSNGTQIVHRIL